jgi:hypothetical protein
MAFKNSLPPGENQKGLWYTVLKVTRKNIRLAVAAGSRWRETHPEQAGAQRMAGVAAANRWRESNPGHAEAILEDARVRYKIWRIERPEEAKASGIKGGIVRQGQGPRATNTSGYKGVYWDKRKQKWASIITVKGKHKRLGYFRDKEEAGLAYNKAARKYFGPHAYQNPISLADSWA